MANTYPRRFNLPNPMVISAFDSGYVDMPSQSYYTQVEYNYGSGAYGTTHQQEEINRLQKQLVEKEKKRNDSVKSIIGYFYKSRK